MTSRKSRDDLESFTREEEFTRREFTPYVTSKWRRELLVSRTDLLMTGATQEQLLVYVGAPDLTKACLKGLVDLVQMLLRLPDVQIEELDMSGKTPLLSTVDHCMMFFRRNEGCEKCCQLLVQHGANPNHKLTDDITPLHHAVARGFWRLTEDLAQKGAQINAEDSLDYTPLDVAILRGTPDSIKCAEILLNFGADTTKWSYDKVRNCYRTPPHRVGHLSRDARSFIQRFLDTTLKHQAREALRRQIFLGNPDEMAPRIRNLQLPPPLRRYLLYLPPYPSIDA